MQADTVTWVIIVIAAVAAIAMLHTVAIFMLHSDETVKLHRRVAELRKQYFQRDRDREEHADEDLILPIEPEPAAKSKHAA